MRRLKMLWRMAERSMRRKFIALGCPAIFPLLFAMIMVWLELPGWTVWIQLGIPAVGGWRIARRLQLDRK